MRKIDEIILHHSAFPASKDGKKDFEKIKSYHLSKGFTDIGYHFVISAAGSIYLGRSLDKIGAHCKGYNSYSIGICIVGDFSANDSKPTNLQIKALDCLVLSLRTVFGAIPINPHLFHRNTICPGKYLSDYCLILNTERYVPPVY